MCRRQERGNARHDKVAADLASGLVQEFQMDLTGVRVGQRDVIQLPGIRVVDVRRREVIVRRGQVKCRLRGRIVVEEGLDDGLPVFHAFDQAQRVAVGERVGIDTVERGVVR